MSGYLSASNYPHTPDGRYFVVRGRLWRLSNPGLAPAVHTALAQTLMGARRAVRAAKGDAAAMAKARAAVDAAKVALGERGAVWRSDGAPDYSRRMVANTPYQQWYAEHAGPGVPTGNTGPGADPE